MDNQIEIAVTILSALLTGGFILFFIENRHAEYEVNTRFRTIMNPYYKKLSNLMIVSFFLQNRYTFTRKDTHTEKSLNILAKSGSNLYVNSQTHPYIDSEELIHLNDMINNVWYWYDNREYEHFSFDDSNSHVFSKEQIYEKIKNISPTYTNYEFTRNLLAEICGAFYSDIWQPVENITFYKENWDKETSKYKELLFSTIIFTMVLLIALMIFGGCIHFGFIVVSVTFCCILFLINIHRLDTVMNEANMIFYD